MTAPIDIGMGRTCSSEPTIGEIARGCGYQAAEIRREQERRQRDRDERRMGPGADDVSLLAAWKLERAGRLLSTLKPDEVEKLLARAEKVEAGDVSQ